MSVGTAIMPPRCSMSVAWGIAQKAAGAGLTVVCSLTEDDDGQSFRFVDETSSLCATSSRSWTTGRWSEGR